MKEHELVIPFAFLDRLDDRQPCYYANVEKNENLNEYKWVVGCKSNGQTEECIIAFEQLGDTSSEWDQISGLDCAIKLIDAFRNGKSEAVNELIKEQK